MVRQSQVRPIFHQVIFPGQTLDHSEVNGLRQADAAADFLGGRSPAQWILVVIGLQGHENVAFQDRPALRGIDHRGLVGAQLAQYDHFFLAFQPPNALQDLRNRQVGPAGEDRQIARAPLVGDAEQDVFSGAFIQGGQPLNHVRREAAVPPPWIGVHHLTAPQSVFRRADNKEVPLDHGQGLG